MSQEISEPAKNLMDPPSESPQMNHGRTFAGWFLFWVASLGALIIAVGAVTYNWTIIWIGAGVAVAGLIISAILRLMGYGQQVKKTAPPTVEDL